MASYLILNILFSILVVGGIVGLLVWSIATQSRDHACEAIGIHIHPQRRVSTKVALREQSIIQA